MLDQGETLTSEEKDRENDASREADTSLDYSITDAEIRLFGACVG